MDFLIVWSFDFFLHFRYKKKIYIYFWGGLLGLLSKGLRLLLKVTEVSTEYKKL